MMKQSTPAQLGRLRSRRFVYPWLALGFLGPAIPAGILYLVPSWRPTSTAGSMLLLGVTLFILAHVAQTVHWTRQHRRAQRHGNCLCQRCRYVLDARQEPRRCPECGGVYSSELLAWFWSGKGGPPPRD